MKPGAVSAIESVMLTPEERGEGWTSPFDGKSFRGWINPSGEGAPPPGWRIVDGALATVPHSAGVPVISLRTREECINFDLKFAWKVQQKAKPGCIYPLFTLAGGMQYQIADDNGDPGARVDPRQRSGALYGVMHERIEPWLNGVKTSEYPVDVPLPSPLVLQDHFPEVEFRNLRSRRLP